MNQEIEIRNAKCNIEEGKIFARLLDSVTEGFISKILGSEFEKIIAEAYMKPNNNYSYQNISFAVKDKTICGMIACYSYERYKDFNKKILSESKFDNKKNIRKLYFFEALFMRSVGVKLPGEYYLQAIIVTEQSRGTGLGQKLMEKVEADARKSGSKILSLDVFCKNSRAIDLYKKQNMIIDSKWPKFPLFPSIFFRMIKRLD